MARGNARDLAREKNQKKQQEQAKKKGISDKGSNQGLTLEQRKQRVLYGKMGPYYYGSAVRLSVLHQAVSHEPRKLEK
eukprot:XP_016659078.1 PREDICTED: small EDRK-rich factor 1 isoform X1 [Acyrthosiphon pisum]